MLFLEVLISGIAQTIETTAMNTPSFLQTKMNLPEVPAPAPSRAQQILSQPFVAPAMTKEQPARPFIPDDLDLSDLKAPDPTGLSALVGTKMNLPNLVRPETVAEQILKTRMPLPTMRPEEPERVFIPADVDLSVEPRQPDGFDKLLKTPFIPPVLVKEPVMAEREPTVAERVLSTKMTLPGGSFAQAVALTTEVDKPQARAYQPEL